MKGNAIKRKFNLTTKNNTVSSPNFYSITAITKGLSKELLKNQKYQEKIRKV